MTFRLAYGTIQCSGLLRLIRGAKRHRIDVLIVTPRHQSFAGGEGVVVTNLFIKSKKCHREPGQTRRFATTFLKTPPGGRGSVTY